MQLIFNYGLQSQAPSHASKITQSCIQRKIPSIISKEVWPTMSPDLNPRHSSIWRGELGGEALMAKLVKEWAVIPQETIRAACASFSAR